MCTWSDCNITQLPIFIFSQRLICVGDLGERDTQRGAWAHQKYENVEGFQHRGGVFTLLHSFWSCVLTWLRAEEFKHGQFWMHFWMSGSQLEALLPMLHLIWEDRAATCPTDQWYHMKRWSQYTFKRCSSSLVVRTWSNFDQSKTQEAKTHLANKWCKFSHVTTYIIYNFFWPLIWPKWRELLMRKHPESLS